jgi:hypothetical protein
MRAHSLVTVADLLHTKGGFGTGLLVDARDSPEAGTEVNHALPDGSGLTPRPENMEDLYRGKLQ